MASKKIYPVIAALGIAAAGGAAWWLQRPNTAPAGASETAPQAAAVAQAVAPQGGPPGVEAVPVAVVRLQDDAQAVGTLRSRQSVMLKPEVAGRIAEIAFRDGTRVRSGQTLVRLDDTLQRAELKQAEAQLSIARANLKRNQELLREKFVAQRAVDESRAALRVAEAQVALARARLARMTITAPFAGVVGIAKVGLGDYVKDGAELVNLEDIEALYVDFRLPERLQAKVKRGQLALVHVDALPEQQFSALIEAIDPLVDADGRSLSLRGCIDNRALQLRPGMFARVTTVFGTRERALVIPEEAIVPQGGRQFVLRLDAGPQDAPGLRTARRVEIKMGLRQPGRVEVLEGLKAGDLIVTAGQQRVQRDGTVVRVAELPEDVPTPPVNASVASPAPAQVQAVASTAPGNPCRLI